MKRLLRDFKDAIVGDFAETLGEDLKEIKEDLKRFQCSYCGKRFWRRFNMIKHVHSKHECTTDQIIHNIIKGDN